MSEGIAGGIADMVAQMGAIRDMVARDAEQKAQNEAQQAADTAAHNEAQQREFSAFVETAYLIGAADGHLSGGELEALTQGISKLTEGRYDAEQIQEMIRQATGRLNDEGKQARIDAVASVITNPELRRAAFVVGAGLVWLDGGVGEKEGLTLQAISKAFDIPMNEMHQLLGKAKKR